MYILILNRNGSFVLLVVVALAGCVSAPQIPEHARTFDGAPFVVEELDGGEILVALEATSEETWTYFDLDNARAVIVDDPFEDLEWDLAFQRFRVKSNGGASGNGDVAVAALEIDDFEQSVAIDSIEWRSDSDTGIGFDYAFASGGNWYRYQMRTHTLESRRRVMMVRSTVGVVYRLQMLTYYDRFLISGYPTFRYIKS